MKPTIFLDIDGVLATSHQQYINPKKWDDVYNRYRYDIKCVKVFNEIIEKTNPIIILSSDWKLHYDSKMLKRIFEINGINCTITDITDDLWGVKFKSLAQLEDCRADEILKYVHDHQIENWVAIDDLDLSTWISEEHFVCTPRANEGIKQSGIKNKIIKKITNE
jgi:hypothetical protein